VKSGVPEDLAVVVAQNPAEAKQRDQGRAQVVGYTAYASLEFVIFLLEGRPWFVSVDEADEERMTLGVPHSKCADFEGQGVGLATFRTVVTCVACAARATKVETCANDPTILPHVVDEAQRLGLRELEVVGSYHAEKVGERPSDERSCAVGDDVEIVVEPEDVASVIDRQDQRMETSQTVEHRLRCGVRAPWRWHCAQAVTRGVRRQISLLLAHNTAHSGPRDRMKRFDPYNFDDPIREAQKSEAKPSIAMSTVRSCAGILMSSPSDPMNKVGLDTF
jgi:hypothetical protein